MRIQGAALGRGSSSRCHSCLPSTDAATPCTRLRTMFSPPWACVSGCGACCYLAPGERDLGPLSPADRQKYVAMAGKDGWCINFDRASHMCQIYDDRPSFCRIENLGTMYGVAEEELGDFAADSCREHIASVHGEDSDVGRQFEEAQAAVRTEGGWEEVGEDDEAEWEREAAAMSAEEIRLQVLEALKAQPKNKDLRRALSELERELGIEP